MQFGGPDTQCSHLQSERLPGNDKGPLSDVIGLPERGSRAAISLNSLPEARTDLPSMEEANEEEEVQEIIMAGVRTV